MTKEKVQNKGQTIQWLKKKYKIEDRQLCVIEYNIINYTSIHCGPIVCDRV
jgi:hypothetical protein